MARPKGSKNNSYTDPNATRYICGCVGLCFAKSTNVGPDPRCKILKEPYQSNCPFQKLEREVTNGKLYPTNPFYAVSGTYNVEVRDGWPER